MLHRRRLFAATMQLSGLKIVTKKAVQQWSELLTPILMHRMECMLVLHTLSRWLSRLPEEGGAPIPANIRDEVIGVALVIVLAESNMRWPVESRLIATDATP